MQNEATNTMQERLLRNPHLATNLRRKLLEAKGRFGLAYGLDDPFVHVLHNLTDSQLVEKYIAHGIRTKIEPAARKLTAVQVL